MGLAIELGRGDQRKNPSLGINANLVELHEIPIIYLPFGISLTIQSPESNYLSQTSSTIIAPVSSMSFSPLRDIFA